MESESMEAKVKMVKSMVDSEVLEADVLKALSLSNNNARAAVDIILDSPSLFSLQPHLRAHKTHTSTGGTRIQVNLSKTFVEGVEGMSVDGLDVVKQEAFSVENGYVGGGGEREGTVVNRDLGIGRMEIGRVKQETDLGTVGAEAEVRVKEESDEEIHGSSDAVNREPLSIESGEVAVPLVGERDGILTKCDMGVGAIEVLQVKEEPCVSCAEGEKKDISGDERALVLWGRSNLTDEDSSNSKPHVRKEEAKGDLSSSLMAKIRVKDEPCVETEAEVEVTSGVRFGTQVKEGPCLDVENKCMILVKGEKKQLTSVQPISSRKLSDDEYRRMQRGCSDRDPKRAKADQMILSNLVIEDGDFPEEAGWLLVGRTVITGLSTTKGRKLENNEIVHFAFPSTNTRTKIGTHFMSSKAAHASSNIVRFSTKRFGEV